MELLENIFWLILRIEHSTLYTRVREQYLLFFTVAVNFPVDANITIYRYIDTR